MTGLAATLLDSAMGCAVHTTLPDGVGYTTLELKVNYTRPITTDTGRIVCEGKMLHRGSRVATGRVA
jgi:acyl-CoA thioesterase